MSDQTYTRSRPGFASSVIDTARENPLAAALVGMGLAWLFAGDRSLRLGTQAPAAAGRALSAGSVMADMPRSAGEAIGSASEYATNVGASAARQAADIAASAASRASEAVGSGMNQAGDLAGSMGGTLRTTSSRAVADLTSSARSQFGQMLDGQPLLLAAGAFAVGAAMAASLPLTKTEERVLEDAAENAMQSGHADSIGAQLQNAAAAAKEEARRQRLTPAALKTEVEELRDRMSGAIGGVPGANSPPA